MVGERHPCVARDSHAPAADAVTGLGAMQTHGIHSIVASSSTPVCGMGKIPVE